MAKCLVTGGAGFIGSNLVDMLIEQGHEVVVIDNCSADNEKFYWNEKASNHQLDICDYDAVRPLFEGIDYVFHLAAESRLQPSIANPIETTQKNVVGTCIVLQCSRESGVEKFIYSSTSSAYGLNPPPNDEDQKRNCLNPYAITKVAAEDICSLYTQLYGLKTVIFRYFNVYGERSPDNGQYLPVVGIFLKQNANKDPLTIVGDGSQRRDFIHVKDIARANIMAAEKDLDGYYGQVFNVGSGTNISVKEIADLISSNQVFIPERDGEAKITLANIDKIKNIIGWKPEINIEQWVKDALPKKINLSSTTFIIPIRIEHPDRERNAITVLSYLLNNFKTNVIVKELDTESNFTNKVLPRLKEFCSDDSLSQLTHIFEYSEDPVFYRTQILNEMLSLCKTEVVVNYDVDVLVEPSVIIESVSRIIYGDADVVYPFEPHNRLDVFTDIDMCEAFIKNNYNFEIFKNNMRADISFAGYVQFFRRSSYIEGGMENENFKGSAPEDWERLHRFNTLGYKVERINNPIYHLEHYRGNNSYPTSITGNPNWNENQALYEKLTSLSKEDLKNYYKEQEYIKKYLGEK